MRAPNIGYPVLNGTRECGPGTFVIEKGKKAEIQAAISSGEAKIRITMEEGASLVFKSESSGASSLVIDCSLSGAGASVEITSICRAAGNNAQKSVANITHSAPLTRSLVRSKGAAWDRAQIELSGLAKIEESAHGSVSRVECKALLLGDEAGARADPLLEILNNDVDCSHAASVREIEKEKIFYLQSRGLSSAEAQQIIADGFLAV
jgi:Fe-S cluster assembly scaffold protein SufB